MNTGLLISFWKSLSKQSYSNWSNVKEFKQYLVSKESLKLTKGLFETRVLIEHQDIETAQSITYKNFKESNWTWSKDNPTGFHIHETHDGTKCITDKFENQSIWVAVCKQNEICSVARTICKFKERQTLDAFLYMQNDICLENQPLTSYLKKKRLVEFQRLFTKPDYRQQGIFFMLFWCILKVSYIAGVDGVCCTSTHNFQNIHPNIKRWEFDYGDGVKTNLFYLSSQYLPECTNYFERQIGSIYT